MNSYANKLCRGDSVQTGHLKAMILISYKVSKAEILFEIQSPTDKLTKTTLTLNFQLKISPTGSFKSVYWLIRIHAIWLFEQNSNFDLFGF